MTDKEAIKQFLGALANDDYVEADKHFPNVVSSSINNLINNKKPAVIERLNAEAEKSALSAVELTKPAATLEEPKT